MAFTHLMSDLVIVNAPSRGMAETKIRLWDKTIEDAKEALLERELTAEAYEKGCDCIDALRTKSDAEMHSPGALKTYRYIGETQTRALISASYENMLPFDFSFQWSAVESERRLSQLSWLLKSLTISHTSRLLRHYPVALIATMMDFMANTSGRDITWWDDDQNRKSVVQKATKMMQGFKDSSVSKEEVNFIKACMKLFHYVTLQLPHYDNDPSLLIDHVEELEGEFGNRVSAAAQSNSSPTNLVFVEYSDVERIFRELRSVNPVMGWELSMLILLQKKLVQSSNSKSLEAICYDEEATEGQERGFCFDPIFIDVVRMVSDMSKCIRELKADENEEIVGHFMGVCGEFWDKTRRLNVRKLFQLAIVLTEGLDVEKVDNSDLVFDITSKIDDDGKFFEGRKKRVNMKARKDRDRRKKRGPCYQPRIRIKRRTDLEVEEDDPSPDEMASNDDENASSPRKRAKKMDASDVQKRRVPESSDSQREQRKKSVSNCNSTSKTRKKPAETTTKRKVFVVDDSDIEEVQQEAILEVNKRAKNTDRCIQRNNANVIEEVFGEDSLESPLKVLSDRARQRLLPKEDEKKGLPEQKQQTIMLTQNYPQQKRGLQTRRSAGALGSNVSRRTNEQENRLSYELCAPLETAVKTSLTTKRSQRK